MAALLSHLVKWQGGKKKEKREKSDVEAKVNCPLLHNVIHLSPFKENYHPSCKPTPPRAPHHTNFFLSSINESPVDASGGINSGARRNNSSSFPAPKAGVFIRKAIHTADATKHQNIFWQHILEDTGSGPHVITLVAVELEVIERLVITSAEELPFWVVWYGFSQRFRCCHAIFFPVI